MILSAYFLKHIFGCSLDGESPKIVVAIHPYRYRVLEQYLFELKLATSLLITSLPPFRRQMPIYVLANLIVCIAHNGLVTVIM